MNTKKVAIFLALLGMLTKTFAATPALLPLEDVSFAKYRVLSQGQFLGGPDGATYMIATNPRLAILVLSSDSGVVKRIATGTMHRCRLMTAERRKNIEQVAITMNQQIAQLDMAVSMGTVSPDDQQSKMLKGSKNYIEFVNESMDMPTYACELSQ